MTKKENKTKPTSQSPLAFVNRVEDPGRRADALRLMEIFRETTGLAPILWGPGIIGYGRYHYQYESGREGDFMLTGFSPRKANLVIYIMPGYAGLEEQLSRLGKHKLGKSCLYIKRLADVDETVLAEIIDHGVQYMRAKHETWDE